MISTEFFDGQGLGNQLWTYVACCSIAEQCKMPHRIINIDKFKGHSFLEIDAGDTSDSETLVTLFNEETFYDPELDYFSSDFDARVLTLKEGTRIRGLFQSEDYFFGDLSRLKRYVRLKAQYRDKPFIEDDCCVVYFRGGEYKRHKNLILPKSYWVQAMRNITRLHGITNFVAVSDDDPYVRALFPDLPILPGQMEEDYTALYQAKFAIVANSSWGYFPTKTGVDKTCVIAPLHWARFGNRQGRWASPANLYQNWLWQDVSGNLSDYEECLSGKRESINHYRHYYNVTTSADTLSNPGLRRFIPEKMRKNIKKNLSKFFPKHIG